MSVKPHEMVTFAECIGVSCTTLLLFGGNFCVNPDEEGHNLQIESALGRNDRANDLTHNIGVIPMMNKYFSGASSIRKTRVLLQTDRYCVLPVMTSGSLDLRYLPLPPENKENEKLILLHVNHRFVYLFSDGVDAPSGPRRRFPERDGGWK
ncbi:hypothetical protein TNIN_281841 [Trichonephila inaurata madagascariensis]|uniref:Uncharacterized protein n=1 Tax=Trichonephila inaurata madagascariensis TaxID=2747483 RepID=A0A8X6X768_9ARAC|nr:hypothetical protein TNIN_281841 [Trichonephila inaurata madagascariensis]